ncbi:MAG: hypothetical protein GQ574_11870 [Crocinitomix sp.]|nr:hypothetical protein [Crocinitomix sp.]
MTHSKQHHFFIALGFIFLITLFSCRKKEERYEGNYVGTETHTIVDSSASVLDTAYYQEIDISYSKKIYTFAKMFNHGGEIFVVDKRSIVDHVFLPFGELYTDQQGNEVGGVGYLRFTGDKIYLTSTSYWNSKTTTFEFNGERE